MYHWQLATEAHAACHCQAGKITYVLAHDRVCSRRWKGALPRVTIQMPVYKVSLVFLNCP